MINKRIPKCLQNHHKKRNCRTSFFTITPVSVHPNFQKKGIGGKLILESHRIAKSLDYQSIVLLGHADYYPRFGYEMTSKYNIRLPFEAPEECCMVIGLQLNGLDGVTGEVVYSGALY